MMRYVYRGFRTMEVRPYSRNISSLCKIDKTTMVQIQGKKVAKTVAKKGSRGKDLCVAALLLGIDMPDDVVR